MKVNILTIFPEMFTGPFTSSIIKRACEKKVLDIKIHNIRDYAYDKHKMTDDYSYGGGPGMVMKPEPIFRAVREINQNNDKKVVLLCPQGKPLTQKKAAELAREKELIFICGHYEGVDERVREHLADEEISIGDYILTGGELPSMVIVDAIARLLPDALGDDLSSHNETFNDGLFDFPCYTRPEDFEGMKVPEVLLSGNHESIDKWRQEQKLKNTAQKRPELLNDSEYSYKKNVYIGLLHHSIVNKNKESVITSITNMDIHDLCRISATYSIRKFFCINPIESQKLLAQRIVGHWIKGYGAEYNSNRKEALGNIELIDTLDDTLAKIKKEWKKKPILVLTDAKKFSNNISYLEMRHKIFTEEVPFLILFGTGWGVDNSVVERADYILDPIIGIGEFNHLSVRSAVSIIIDRLLSKR